MTSNTKITVAVSARALFDFEAENQVFCDDDPSAYCALQATRLDIPASPGVAFPLVRKFLAFNGGENEDVEVAILSRNDPVTGLRVFASARHHGLAISRAIFTSGAKPHWCLAPLEANLFLSAHASDVREAMAAGFAAARVCPASGLSVTQDDGELRIAFDGDSVLFSDEAERVFRQRQLQEFNVHEARHARSRLPPGPLKPFLAALCALRGHRRSRGPVRMALVTARSAPAHERAIRTLMAWGVAVDEAMFLGGKDKTRFLAESRPDIFFDDHVPYGINNECRPVLH
ncbi:5'-nucleotidase [Paraburkholderia sp. BCC1876]|uniref:5'-nucleotidase n=1 Tax=Paraburkholderia sp. BCC1876 TaxID=2676303 RepID=UPI00158FBA7D|nr:5'-nucleotidase [Paraburkholderia sp. BCC1876]